MQIKIQGDASQAFIACQPDYRATLVAPLDDMWAAFAEMAEPYALLVGGRVAGCCTVNDERELHHFYLHPEFEDRAEGLFAHLIDHLKIVAALPSTVDPSFLSLSIAAGHRSTPAALMFQHVLAPIGTALADLRCATAADHSAAVAFAHAATGKPAAFLSPYFGERIERGELHLHEKLGEILASGECRVDRRHTGFAHLGLIVGSSQRRRGLGGQLMHALVKECQRRELLPLCSTEPDNLPARKVIYRAGFRARHRVFRVEVGVLGEES